MSFLVIDIREPTNSFYSNVFISLRIDSASGSEKWVVFWNSEFSIPTMNAFSEPNSIFLNEFEKIFIRYRVLVSDDDEFFLIFEELSDIFTKE